MRHIFEIIWICWFLSEILLNRLFRSKMINSQDMDKSSLRLIWIAIIISISSGIISRIFLRFPINDSHLFGLIGLLVIVAGMIIRFISILTLGKFFTVDLAIHDGHKLINKGFYKYIRHPSYTGSLVSFLGFGLSLNNWISLVVIFVPVLISFINRINIEEKLLLEQLGLEYKDYKERTKRLIPMVY
jgi:protein-S-isoprenylcysteine O-methyltransferase Ste14